MFLFSRTIDTNGEYHVINRWKERIQLGPEMLVKIVAECNQYIPDDWRIMGAPADWQVKRMWANRFRIDVRLNDAGKAAALIGRSYRLSGNKFLHIIYTILNVYQFTAQIVRDYQEEHNIALEKIDAKTRAALEEIVVPNLYYFSPCPEDSPSPLFARQYERIKYNNNTKVGAQYHRIHALTRKGVDPDHFRWVFWNTKGEVHPVAFPSSDFHGKSYYGVPTFNQARIGSEHQYQTLYNQFLSQFDVQVAHIEKRPYLTYETEFKWGVNITENEAFGQIQQRVCDLINTLGYSVSNPERQEQEDLYLDDDAYTLLRAGVSFRLRKLQDNMRITLKKRFPEETPGLYKRIEEEMVISQEQEIALRAGKSITALPYRLIAYVAPGCGAVKPVVTIKNSRTLHIISDNSNLHGELCFDKVYFSKDNQVHGPVFEIELESKGMPYTTLQEVATTIGTILVLQAAQETKYERAIDTIDTRAK